MGIEEAIAFLRKTSWMGSRLGLDRVAELLRRLGDPQNKLKFVHIAGTNGKGSTAAMTAAILQAAGYRTGLYTSPSLSRFNERIRVDGREITDAELIALTEQVQPYVEAMQEPPTEFELITAAAFLYFYQQQCDVVVLEVGMGGRLDATNAIAAPEAAVITGIGLDHTRELGDTLEKIAMEKAGIIKAGCSTVLCTQTDEVEAVIKQVCAQRSADLTVTDIGALVPIHADTAGQSFDYRERKSLKLALLGNYQLNNAAVALDTVDVLRKKGWGISEEAIYAGLRNATWAGRFELLRQNPPVVVDGAHNPNGVAALVECIKTYFPGKKLVIVTGVMADKDYAEMAGMLAPYAQAFVTVTPDNPRALPSAEYKQQIQSAFSGQVLDKTTVEAGLRAAEELAGASEIILCCGSLYMAGAVRAYFRCE